MLSGDRVRMQITAGKEPSWLYGTVIAVGSLNHDQWPIEVFWDNGGSDWHAENEIEVVQDAPEVPESGLKDSGQRHVSETGFTKEPDTERADLTWIFEVEGLELIPRELIERLALHYQRGAIKYSANNWKLGTDPDSLQRFKRSAARHFVQWGRGEDDEDHASALTFNVWAYEVCSRG